MKRIILMILMAAALTARADLIPQTPGGWNWDIEQQIPDALNRLILAEVRYHLIAFFDEARVVPWFDPNGVEHPPGWVSHYGKLNGGTLFSTDLLDRPPTADARVSWDFGDTGYRMGWIDLWGTNEEGQLIESWYKTKGPAFKVEGSGTVTLDGFTDITSIAFYGHTPGPLPESGSSLLYLSLALAALTANHRVFFQKAKP
jgi:hypothetical protein